MLWKLWWKLVCELRPACGRTRTFLWMTVCLAGMTTRRDLMGVGTPRVLSASVRAGMDMFDCVLPTRNGRNAYAFPAKGPLKLRNEAHAVDDSPLEDGCTCYSCSRFSRGYIRHLFMAGEMLGPTLASIHNLHFYQRLMARMRDLIPRGELATIPQEFPVVLAGNASSDP